MRELNSTEIDQIGGGPLALIIPTIGLVGGFLGNFTAGSLYTFALTRTLYVAASIGFGAALGSADDEDDS